MVDLGSRTTRGGLTAFVAQATRILVQLGIMAVLARLLTPADFGLIAMATALTSFVGLFADLGLSAATVQRKEIDQRTVSALFQINVAMGLALMVVCAALAPLAAWIFGDARVVPVAMAAGLAIPVTAAGAQHGALLQRGMRWKASQWTPILAQSAGGLTAILLAWRTEAGYWALVAQLCTTALVSTSLFWVFCPWRPDLRPRWREAGSALDFGLHLTGFNFVNYFHRQFDNVLIGWRWGPTELGQYTRAYMLLTLPLTLVSAPMASAVVPALSRLQDDPERWRNAFLKAFGALNLVSAGLTAVLIATAEPLVELVYGRQWAEAGHVFALLAISMFAATPMNATGWIYVSLGQTARALRWSLFVTPFYAGAFLVGLPYGAAGVALSYSLAICLVAVPCIGYATKWAPVGLGAILRLALPPAVLGASVVGLMACLPKMMNLGPWAQVVAAFVIGGGAYGIGAILLLMIDPAQRPVRYQSVTFLRRWLRHLGVTPYYVSR